MSRLNRDLLPADKLNLAAAAREHLALYRKNKDLINIGAYPAGSSAVIDRAIALKHQYNIRVINLSIGRPIFESYTLDPLCAAVTAAL